MTKRQRRFLYAMAANKGVDGETMQRIALAIMDVEFDKMTKQQTVQFIGHFEKYTLPSTGSSETAGR